MLLEKIRQASVEARFQKNTVAAALLVTLYAEAARVGKDNGNRETTDAETQAVVRKFLKGLNETMAVIKDGPAHDVALAEKGILEGFLPRQVAGDELKAVVHELVAALPERTPKSLGAVMGQLKARLGGAYDGAEATALVKQALA